MLLVGLLAALPAFSQSKALSDQLAKTVQFAEPAISANGRFVAYLAAPAPGQQTLYIADLKTAAAPKPVALPGAVTHADEAPAWNPDGTALAFLSTTGKSTQAQLWTVAASGLNARSRGKVNGFVARPKWSPDGKQIAFLYVEGAGGGGPLYAAPAATGVINAEIHNQRVAVVDLATNQQRFATPTDLHVYDFDWSPDSRQLVATAAPGPGDNNWWIAQLYTIDIASMAAKSIYKPKWQLAVPRWSPDGKTIAFIEGLMSDEGFHGGDLMLLSATGGEATNVTAGRTANPSGISFLANGRVLFTEWSGGGSAVSLYVPERQTIETLYRAEEDLHIAGNFPSLAVDRDGQTVVAVRSSFAHPPEVWAGRIGDWKPLTKANATLTPAWGEAKSITWTSEGRSVQGWLLPPKNVDTDRKYPMVVTIHGGPSDAAVPRWPGRSPLTAQLAAAGYYVFLPNPRGSYGQGETFTQANRKDFGYGDLRDVLAGVDAVIAQNPVDPERLGITGWSYGGYMTMWTVTQTNRFKAAMAGAGIANWKSYYGQNLIDQWMIPFFGASVYDDPAVYAKSSPIEFIQQVQTPTLILVGERDAECPAPQSYEFWHALRARNVPTELVVYEGEGHALLKQKNRMDLIDRTLAWFARYLAPRQ